MVIFRIISLLFIAAALMLLGADIISYLDHEHTRMLRSLTDVVQLFSAGAAEHMTAWKDGLPGGVQPVVGAIFKAPAWIPLGIVGIILAFLFRSRD